VSPHIPLEWYVPYISRIGAISKSFGVSLHIVKVLMRYGQVNDVFMAIGKSVCGWFRHPTDLSPNNPVPHDPAIIGGLCLHPARNCSESLVMVCVTDVKEHRTIAR
jgi:hypothetical protein